MDQALILVLFVIVCSVQSQTFVGVPGNSWPHNCNSPVIHSPCASRGRYVSPPTMSKLPGIPATYTPQPSEVFNPKRCKDTFEWDEISNKCACPSDSPNYDELIDMCVECVGGMIWNELTEKCVCPSEGAPWNPLTMECACSDESFWNPQTKSCECTGGRIWDDIIKDCICEGNTVFDKISKRCSCEKGRVWDSKNECSCPKNKPNINYETNECVPCETGKYWNDNLKECVCLGDQEWNPLTRLCECPWNTVWDPIMKSCLCGTEKSLKSTCEGKSTCQFSTEVLPVCDGGYKLSYDNRCYSEAKPECEIGTTSFKDACVLMKKSDVVCPPAYTYNSLSKMCVSIIEPTCRSGQTFHNGECIEEVIKNPKCPWGYDMIYNKCVTFKESHCPPGYENISNKCVKKMFCKEGQKLENGICVTVDCPKGYILKCGFCELPVIVDCPLGFVLDGTFCRRRVKNCPRGFTLEKDTCTRKLRGCPFGFIPVGHECHRKLKGCPPGFYLIDGVCKRRVITSCPRGYHLDGDSCIRTVSRPLTTCANDEEELRGKCVKKSPSTNCNPGEALVNGRCIYSGFRCKPDEAEVEGKCYPICVGAACKTDCTSGRCLIVGSSGNPQTTNGYIYSHGSPYISNVNNVNVYGGSSNEGTGCSYKCRDNEKYINQCEYVC